MGAEPGTTPPTPGAALAQGVGAGRGEDLRIVRGSCVAVFAYDLGLSIDLREVERCLQLRPGEAEQRDYLRRSRRAPRYFEFKPPPIRLTRPVEPIEIGGHATAPSVDVIIYDFGAVSIAYTLPLSGWFGDLIPLGNALYENAALLEHSRRFAERLTADLASAIKSPNVSPLVEDHLLFQIVEHELPAGETLARWIERNRARLAQLLRAEQGVLSEQEIAEALACRVSYADSDAAIIDWNATVLFDADSADACAAIDFANVELLEMRHLDDRLDSALEEVYQRSRAEGGWGKSSSADLKRVAELQTDSALLFEGVNNAVKLLGDQYLARVYRLAAQRFHLPEWDANILRKLATLESIYQKMSDRESRRRTEVLEVIVILLIAFEVAMGLMSRMG